MRNASLFARSRKSPLPAAPDVPVVPGHPVIGNLIAFRRDRLALHDEAMRLGRIACFYMASTPVYVVTCADLAHRIFVEDAESYRKGIGMRFLRPLLGDGLLSADGPIHRRHRKLLAPAFAPKRLAAYGDVMVEETLAQIARWRPGQTLDLAHEVMEITIAIGGRTLFHADLRREVPQISRGMLHAMHAMAGKLASVIPLGYEWPLPHNLRLRRAVKLLDEVVYGLIAQGRRDGTDRGDVLSMLMLTRDETGTGLTDQEVRDEVMTLVLGSYETTATALAWTLYELGRNPDVLARVAEEIRGVIGDRAVTVDDLPAMPLNLAVIEESMRLHPPAFQANRQAIRDVEVDGRQFPSGTLFNMYIRGIHHRETYYPEPLAFRPERFLGEAKKVRPRHHYLPFGAGPRICIGGAFSLLEAQLICATIVQRTGYRLLNHDIQPDPLITLKPRGGVPAVVERT